MTPESGIRNDFILHLLVVIIFTLPSGKNVISSLNASHAAVLILSTITLSEEKTILIPVTWMLNCT